MLSEVPRSVTLRRPWRESRASPHPRASGSQTLYVEDSPPDPISEECLTAGAGQASCTTTGVPAKSTGINKNNPTLILPSKPKATRPTGATSSSRPAVAANTLGSIRSTQVNTRRLTTLVDNRAPTPALVLLPAEIPVVPQRHWLNLPENRIDRWIIIFYMFYAPIILPLVLRILGMV